MIAAVAVLGRNNSPIYLKTFTSDSALKFHFVIHSSLDLVEDRLKRRAKGEKIDKYLGMLYPIEEYKVYGYLTNTDIKFIMVVQDDINIREQEIKYFFLRMHELYVQVSLNPFYEMNSKIESPTFEKAISALVNKGILSDKDKAS